MKSVLSLVVAALSPLAAAAQDAPALMVGPVSATEVTLDQFLWLQRPVVVFADRPDDPQFVLQMSRIEAGLDDLAERDVVVITDTDPAAATDVRQRLRPRGFSLVLMDKDGEVKRRVPSARTVREISHDIDRFPLRRQEMLERRPAGR